MQMKTNILILMILIGFCVSSCKKAETPTTNLELTLKDDLGNIVSGSSVKLYSSETDWTNGTNQVGTTQFSDASGKVKFSDLSNIKYYWFAEKDCKNNWHGASTTTSALTANITNTINVILSSSGTLTFTNTSSNPYHIYINGTLSFEHDVLSLPFQPRQQVSLQLFAYGPSSCRNQK